MLLMLFITVIAVITVTKVVNDISISGITVTTATNDVSVIIFY